MMHVTTKYVNRLPATRGEMEVKAAALVQWAGIALQGMTRMQIVAFGAVDTGNMLNSVGVSFLGPKRAMVYVGADYSHYVNNGTRKMGARPFFDTAVETFRPQFNAAVKSL
jgi:hypothetical protein